MEEINQIIDNILNQEVHYHFCKSGGHGGQNVNKRNTKAELYFNVQDSHFLNEEQKQRLIDLAGHHIHHHEKILILTNQEERSQKANKEKVIHHFKQLLEQAIQEPKQRFITNIPGYIKEKRRKEKIQQSKRKSERTKNFQITDDE